MLKILKQNIAAHIIIKNKNGSYLILKRSSTDKHDPGMWDLAGGGIRNNEILDEGVKREVFEETGLKIGRVYILGVYTIGGGDINLLTFSETKNKKSDVHISKEHNSYKWVDLNYLLKLKDSGFHLKAAQKILKSKTKVNSNRRFDKFKYKGRYYYYLS